MYRTNSPGSILVLVFLCARLAEGQASPTPSRSTVRDITVESGPTTVRMLDSIPPMLFQKMFQSHRLVGSPGLAWKKQRVITVALNGGSDGLYRLIEQTAGEWIALGGQLSFSFKDGTGQYRRWSPNDKSPAANIRVAFDNTGYWSLLGVLAKNVDPGDATMNFDGFPNDLAKYFNGQNTAEWRTSYAHATILHEFGHAIGPAKQLEPRAG